MKLHVLHSGKKGESCVTLYDEIKSTNLLSSRVPSSICPSLNFAACPRTHASQAQITTQAPKDTLCINKTEELDITLMHRSRRRNEQVTCGEQKAASGHLHPSTRGEWPERSRRPAHVVREAQHASSSHLFAFSKTCALFSATITEKLGVCQSRSIFSGSVLWDQRALHTLTRINGPGQAGTSATL